MYFKVDWKLAKAVALKTAGHLKMSQSYCTYAYMARGTGLNQNQFEFITYPVVHVFLCSIYIVQPFVASKSFLCIRMLGPFYLVDHLNLVDSKPNIGSVHMFISVSYSQIWSCLVWLISKYILLSCNMFILLLKLST